MVDAWCRTATCQMRNPRPGKIVAMLTPDDEVALSLLKQLYLLPMVIVEAIKALEAYEDVGASGTSSSRMVIVNIETCASG